jgi:tetratricopeptide (TPR) repeat protein
LRRGVDAVMEKSGEKKRTIVTVLLLVLLVSSVYYKTVGYNFVYYDDSKYVVENYHVLKGLSLEGLQWALTTFYEGNWHPLTWVSHMLDIELFGLRPGFHHLVNVLFHILNTLLLFLVLKRMTGAFWRSFFVAALFALHPLHVESVAWVAERKDVLSAFFWMLVMWFYVLYVEKPSLKRYLLVFLFLVLGLMSKPMLVTLPFVLLLLDYWPLKRFDFESGYRIPFRLIREKIPLFALIFLSSMITFLSQKYGGTIRSIKDFPIEIRIANTLVSYTAYIRKMIWPADLAVFYPHPGSSIPVWKVVMAGLFLVLVTAFVTAMIRKLPYLFVGWFWYLGTLVPVIGLVQVGVQSMADRYTYIPLIGIFIMIVWGVPQILKDWPYKKIFLSFSSGIVLVILTVLTWIQTGYWKNSVTLFEHAINVTHNNSMMHNNLGVFLGNQGKIEEASFHFKEVLKFDPENKDALNLLGVLLARSGKLDEGIKYYEKVLAIDPKDSDANNNLGFTLIRQRKLEQAIPYFQKAIESNPKNELAQTNLAAALAEMGRTDEAIVHFKEGLKINPHDWMTHKNIAIALSSQGKLKEAAFHLEQALQIRPDDKSTRMALEKIREILQMRP